MAQKVETGSGRMKKAFDFSKFTEFQKWVLNRLLPECPNIPHMQEGMTKHNELNNGQPFMWLANSITMVPKTRETYIDPRNV